MSEIRQTVALYNEVIGKAIATAPAKVHDLAGETRKRLEQMDRLVDLLQACVGQIQGSSRKPAAAVIAAVNDGELFAEAFYYFAWRARRAIRQLPGLNNFDCIGVRNVRNHLIEHPEKHVTSGSFTFGGAKIAVLKPSRQAYESSSIVDPGLAANLAEFCANLERRLAKLAP